MNPVTGMSLGEFENFEKILIIFEEFKNKPKINEEIHSKDVDM
jgi:hypothetical protein